MPGPLWSKTEALVHPAACLRLLCCQPLLLPLPARCFLPSDVKLRIPSASLSLLATQNCPFALYYITSHENFPWFPGP